MESFYYVGLDVHKKTVSYAVKTAAGERVAAGSVAATRTALSAWADARLRKKWLPEAGITVRKATPERSLRITWSDGSSVELWFVAKGAGKSAVQVQHRKLPNREAIAERKAYWSERLDALADQLR